MLKPHGCKKNQVPKSPTQESQVKQTGESWLAPTQSPFPEPHRAGGEKVPREGMWRMEGAGRDLIPCEPAGQWGAQCGRQEVLEQS